MYDHIIEEIIITIRRRVRTLRELGENTEADAMNEALHLALDCIEDAPERGDDRAELIRRIEEENA